MKYFIIDKNVDVKPGDAQYPKYFFDDLRGSKKVKIVSGGTNYKKEIKEKRALRELISEMISSNKVKSVDTARVDAHEEILIKKIIEVFGEKPEQCDDPHIVALAHISGCPNIVTKDKRMAAWRNMVRNVIGHDLCPEIRLIMTEAAYRATP